MRILELGARGFGTRVKELGHEVISIEWDLNGEHFEPDHYINILETSVEDILELTGWKPDIIWSSPHCTTYSMAGISHHRRKENGVSYPISEYAKFSDQANTKLIQLIKGINPRYYFIENPRGSLRNQKFMQGLPRYTVTYCQYGDTRMKPTDIWTNHPDPQFKPACKNGDPCHERAPRGSRKGSQRLRGQLDRAKVPQALIEHILKISEV